MILAAVLWLLSQIGRFLPPALNAVWPVAAWTGWSLFFVPSMKRVGPAMAGWNPDPWAWSERLRLGDAALGLVAALALLALGLLWMRRSARERRLTLALVTMGAVVGTFVLALPKSRTPGGDQPVQEGSVTDLIVILVDTLRLDHLGMEIGESAHPALAR